MKKIMSFLLLVTMLFIFSGCTKVEPQNGEEAVWLMHPYLFGHGGVDPIPVKAGLSWGALTSQGIIVSVLPQRVDMSFDDMMTKSGVPVDFHVVITFRILDSVALVNNFGADINKDKDGNESYGFWIRNLDQPIRTAVRDSVKKREMQEMAIDQSAADVVGQEVKLAAIALVQKLKLPIELMDVNVGRVNPPDAIKTQRIETATQEQRRITEQQRKLAEDQRRAAEISRAAADNAYREAIGMNQEQFLRLETIKMQDRVCTVKGSNCIFLIGGTGVNPILNIK
jgi:regulator of protease activity HflC (stomatin/prohibitin superfamily)